MSHITHFYGVKFVAWKSGSVKKLTNIMCGPEGAVFAKAKFGFLLSIPLHSSVFGTSFQLITGVPLRWLTLIHLWGMSALCLPRLL